ncbi:unnamed protein product [Haemonchus placei]|uniref:Ras-associating domain-containing protein n=1 Tax=Haemonchus placei TaxID=6290 RepID=A0A0N4VYJ0_HAEPC|nr:unnamed protein product [Haemonchus placei]
MIVTLLRKFRVADNPRKFALYECAQENDEQTCTLLSELFHPFKASHLDGSLAYGKRNELLSSFLFFGAHLCNEKSSLV